jgi:hypothetical protein
MIHRSTTVTRVRSILKGWKLTDRNKKFMREKMAYEERKIQITLFFLLLIILLFFMISCASTPKLAGKWREIGKTATIEFLEDGSFKAVDNMGMAVSGKYTLLGKGNIRFEVAHQGSSKEIVEGKLSMQEDELVISFGKGKEVERYKRVR